MAEWASQLNLINSKCNGGVQSAATCHRFHAAALIRAAINSSPFSTWRPFSNLELLSLHSNADAAANLNTNLDIHCQSLGFVLDPSH